MLKKTLRNQKGFTLIEIIAVLVILGILAAVAVPKYMDMQDQARIKSGQAAIAEVKARLSNGYAKYLLQNNGANPDVANVITFANNVTDVGPDYNVTVDDESTYATITVLQVQGVDVTNVNTTWNLPQ